MGFFFSYSLPSSPAEPDFDADDHNVLAQPRMIPHDEVCCFVTFFFLNSTHSFGFFFCNNFYASFCETIKFVNDKHLQNVARHFLKNLLVKDITYTMV